MIWDMHILEVLLVTADTTIGQLVCVIDTGARLPLEVH